MERTCIIAEIGINHNGDVNIAKKLIDAAKFAGADIVKFQKRTIAKVYTKEELKKPRISPWGTTNGEQKLGLEFETEEYGIIENYCKKVGIEWFASPWDLESIEFLKQFKSINHQKVASAILTNHKMLRAMAKQTKHTFISTGMSTMEEIERAIDIFESFRCPYTLLHCNSAYPMDPKEANLNMITTLKNKFKMKKHFRAVGYSGHEVGLGISIAAVVKGATALERHITLDRSMYGSDQSSSVEPFGFYRLISYIREIEKAMGDGIKKVTETEKKVKAKLRRIDDFKDHKKIVGRDPRELHSPVK